MSNPTNAVSTELDAVNQILSSVGQAPVSTLDMQNPEVYIVLSTLREVNKQVQSESWTFNTERHVELSRDGNNKIKVPASALSVDANVQKYNDKYNIVRKQGYLYDMYQHTDVFDENLVVDIVWLVTFADLPPIVQSYVVARAARIVSVKLVGDSEIFQLLQEQELQTRVALMEYETQQGDYSMFGFREEDNYYTSYQPFTTLTR
jgi:hypothetical protein